MPNKTISAYIPCFNNSSSIERTIISLRNQTYPLKEILVIDDGSTDNSVEIARRTGVSRVIAHTNNQGRGAIRAQAMEELNSDFVLCCDATIALADDFAIRALSWLEDPEIVGAFGQLRNEKTVSLTDRWRARHIFKQDMAKTVVHFASLSTGGALLKRDIVLKVGNYNSSYRQNEDAELGSRLFRARRDVIYDPELHMFTTSKNSIFQVLERYWRWNNNSEEPIHFKLFLKQLVYSIKVMAINDLNDHDIPSLFISLASPYFQLFYPRWKSYQRSRKRDS